MTKPNADSMRMTAAEKRDLLVKLLQQKATQEEFHYQPSYGQSLLWFVQQKQPDSVAYNESFAWRFKAKLSDVQGLEIAKLILQRHSILRTTYQVTNGQLLAVVHSWLPLDFAAIDAGDWDEDQLRSAIQEHANRPIDLEHGPIIRLRLFQGNRALTWLTTIHHIAIDLASMIVLMEDLKLILICMMTGQPIPAWNNPTYDQFAIWQREFVESEAGIQQCAFWMKQLCGFESLKLPTDFPPNSNQKAPCDSERLRLRQSLTSELIELARVQSTTLFAVLLSAFQILMGRYCRQDQFLLGSFASGRTQTKFEHTIGLLANPIVIPTDLSDNVTFSQYLQRNRRLLAGVLANQDYPFQLLVEQLARQNNVGRSPLVTTSFLLQAHQRTGLDNYDPFTEDAASAKGHVSSIAGVDLEVLPVYQQNVQFNLDLEMFLAGNELMGTLRYDSSLFEATTIAILADCFVALLESIVADPNELIIRLNMSGPKSKEFLASKTTYSNRVPQSLVACLQNHVLVRPDAIAIEDNQCSFSYRELYNQIIKLDQIVCKKAPKDSIVAIYLPRCKDAIAVMLACWRSGRVTLSLDPSHPASRLREILVDAGPHTLVTRKRYEDEITTILSIDVNRCQEIPVVYIDEELSGQAFDSCSVNELEGLSPDPEAIAYVMYTSGSTGQPKGVLIPHRGLNNLWSSMSEVIGISPSDRILQIASLSFDASIAELACALGNGATLVLAEPPQMAGEELWSLLLSSKSTIAILSPPVLSTLPKQFLPDLRCLLVAAEECGRDLVDYWSIGRIMYNAYGPSETSVCATMHLCQPDSRKPAIGRPIPNVRVYLMDRLLQPVPIGALGEICIGGESVGTGYMNQPELNRQKFVVDPLSENNYGRLYRTGDIGRWRTDGTLEFHGRNDRQIKLRGMRLELEEIEFHILKSPEVQQVTVAAGSKYQDQIAAFIVERKTGTVDCQLLQEKLRFSLPAYMVPRWLIKLDRIPLSHNGKLDDIALNRLWRQHIQEFDTTNASGFVPPRNKIERQVAQIFCDVLQRDQVSIHHNFFDLGGHSLMIGEFATRLRQFAPKSVSIYSILSAPTVAGIASLLSES